MGLTQSNPAVPKQYTDADIKRNVQNLFHNNRKNDFSEASYSFREALDNATASDMFKYNEPMKHIGGNHIKFNSSKNRHLLHNIDDYINGIQNGGETLEPISELSELKNIKDFLMKMNDDNMQTGGYLSDLDTITPISNEPKTSMFDILHRAMRGGADNDAVDSDDDSDEESLHFDANDDSDNETVKEEDDDSQEKEDDEDNDDNNDDVEDTMSTTSSASINKNTNFSDTSYSSKRNSSDLNIVPFYSSEEADNFQHPYNKNRFN
jgi:hypothetical protein